MVGVSQLSSSLPVSRVRFVHGRLLTAFAVTVDEAFRFSVRGCASRGAELFWRTKCGSGRTTQCWASV